MTGAVNSKGRSMYPFRQGEGKKRELAKRAEESNGGKRLALAYSSVTS